jgi:Flp pilus assembly protein TadD
VRKACFIAVAWLLAGCMAVGVPATGDPWKKFTYACGLLHAGRVAIAAPAMRESLAYYEKAGEPLKLAVVQMQNAVMLQSPAFAIERSFARERAEMGGRSAIPVRARELGMRARANLERVLAMPPGEASAGDRTQALIFLIDAHAQLGEFREACATIERAAQSYRPAEPVPYHYDLYGHKSVAEHLQDRRDMLECAQG